ncbi:MAG: MmcQ/YjbR family DNA-binding protein [Pseudomonadota bacterium]
MHYADIVALALALPEVAESTSYGTPALKVAGKLMVRQFDQSTIVLRCSWEQRERLTAASPAVFFFTEHYRQYDWVLVRLAALAPEAAPGLLSMAWELAAPPATRKRRGALRANALP